MKKIGIIFAMNEELIETYKKLTKNFDYRNGKVYYK